MIIFILGNGFDLAHGLPTRYIDFLEYCKHVKNNTNNLHLENLEDEFNEILKNNFLVTIFH
ncbi:MAG: bacteriophage abortive infection AbiH family protein [Deltaproteobacteria bacterium]|nr:bacteriophage abortive infection AbiH family protein [Deltaproteobacteria bacterium]